MVVDKDIRFCIFDYGNDVVFWLSRYYRIGDFNVFGQNSLKYVQCDQSGYYEVMVIIYGNNNV